MENYTRKKLIILRFLLKTLLVGTRYNCLHEVVLKRTHNLCCGSKLRKKDILLHTPVLLYKSGVQGVIYIYFTDMFS